MFKRRFGLYTRLRRCRVCLARWCYNGQDNSNDCEFCFFHNLFPMLIAYHFGMLSDFKTYPSGWQTALLNGVL